MIELAQFSALRQAAHKSINVVRCNSKHCIESAFLSINRIEVERYKAYHSSVGYRKFTKVSFLKKQLSLVIPYPKVSHGLQEGCDS